MRKVQCIIQLMMERCATLVVVQLPGPLLVKPWLAQHQPSQPVYRAQKSAVSTSSSFSCLQLANMARLASTCVLALALLPWLCMCTVEIDINDEALMQLPKEELAAHIAGLLSRPGASVTNDDLPAKRPPVYWLCDYSCMNTLQISLDKGVFTLDMT